MIERTETVLRHFTKTPFAEKAASVFLVVLIVSLVSFLSQFLIISFFRISLSFGVALSVFLAYTTFAARELGNAAKAVLRHLDAGEITQARTGLSMIVGRDTVDLNGQEIARAVVETVAENTSDGMIAPLFTRTMGEPALSLVYKAVNTLDPMVGYLNEKYINFGWAAARVDDVANFIPARITAVLICLATEILRGLDAIFPPHLNPLPPGEQSLNSATELCT
jgi:adenosylcobinamide-phosphate synthase